MAKFISNGFQTSVVKHFNITSNGIKFLDWFYQFLESGKMKCVRNPSDKKVYFYIDYAYVMDSVPAINWSENFKSASKMLKRILDDLISKNIIQRYLIKTKGGYRVFIRFVDGVLKLLKSKEYANEITSKSNKQSFKEKRISLRQDSNIENLESYLDEATEEITDDFFCPSEETKMSSREETKMSRVEETKMSPRLSQKEIIPKKIIPSGESEKENGYLGKDKQLEKEKAIYIKPAKTDEVVESILDKFGIRNKYQEFMDYCMDIASNAESKGKVKCVKAYFNAIIKNEMTVKNFLSKKESVLKTSPTKKQSAIEFYGGYGTDYESASWV